VPIPLPSILQNEHLPEGGFRVLVNELSVREGLIEDGAEYEPIVEAVREAIDDRLAMFVGVDELLSALKAMSADDQGFVANVLDDDAETIQLLQTVRKLIARGAPLPLGDMLSQLLPRDPSDIERLVRSMDQRSLLAADSESDGQAEASLRGPSWAVRR
jgi:hypothetical protein